MRPQRGFPALVLVIVLVVLGGCGPGPAAADTTDRCEEQRAIIEALRPDVPVTTGGPVAVVLGDSYTQGIGVADPRTRGWAAELGRLEGWTTFVDGVGGTGYVSGGPCVTTRFATRVPTALARRPETVVVEGGLNDVNAPPEQLRRAVDDVLVALRPVPRVVVVGPTDAPARPTSGAVDALLRDRALAAGRQYVSTQGLPLPFLPDRLHPTPAGYQQFARAVAEAVPR